MGVGRFRFSPRPRFLTEDNLCLRIITDLSVFSSGLTVSKPSEAFGFGKQEPSHNLGFDFLMTLFSATPGLATDKLKAVLELVWKSAEAKGTPGSSSHMTRRSLSRTGKMTINILSLSCLNRSSRFAQGREVRAPAHGAAHPFPTSGGVTNLRRANVLYSRSWQAQYRCGQGGDRTPLAKAFVAIQRRGC